MTTTTPSPTRPKRPSMKDVAKLAGVSRTTVSFVLNEKPHKNIPQRTQERIWEAVKTLGYRPNALARGLRAQRTHTIGFVSDEIGTTPYAGQILQGAQEMAWQHKTLLLSVNTTGKKELKDAGVNALLERQVDGIIFATMYHREAHPPPQIREVPTVLLDCFVKDRSLPSVVPDEIKGGYTATKYLLEAGHRRIAFINDASSVPAVFGRLAGFKQALAEYDVPFDEQLVTRGQSIPTGGYEATKRLMALSQPPTAIFCFNDRIAMGAYDALRKLNKKIPDDVAIIGFDNQQLIAADLHPGLTTMALPHYEMGQWAVEHLLKLIEKPSNGAAPVQHLLECPLIVRESV